MSATTDQTSITVGRPPSAGFVQDVETRSWVVPGSAHGTPTRIRVLRHAQSEIANLRKLSPDWDGAGGVPLRPELANVAWVFVSHITTSDGLATPQLSPSPDGGLEVVWLVGGDRLTLSVAPDELMLYGRWADWREAFRFEHRWGSFTPDELIAALDDARRFLEKISDGVQHQLLMP
jgi:hypothetical protein